jgi:hypothetical protein
MRSRAFSRTLGIVVVALLGAGPAAVGLAGPASAAQQPPGLGISLVPSGAATNDPRDLAYVTNVVAPGSTVTRQVRVTNGTDRTLPVSLYADAATVRGGSFYPADGHGVNALTGWTTVSPSVAPVAAHGSVLVTATVRVPADAVPGERYGVLLAQYQAGASGGIKQVARVGIREYLYVAGPNTPRTDFAITDVAPATLPSGQPAVRVGLSNSGQRTLDLGGFVQLSGPGVGGGPTESAGVLTLAPTARGSLLVPASANVTGRTLTARVSVHSGDTTRSATRSVTFPGVARAHAHRPPWLVITASAALLAVALGLATGVQRSRRRQSPGGSCDEVMKVHPNGKRKLPLKP